MLSFQLRTKIHNDLIHAGIQKERGQADLSQFVHCQGSISAPVSWSHLKRWYWFSLEAWPLRCRCPTDSVSCPLCKALAICLIWLCRQVWWLWEGIFSSTFRFLCVLQQGERDEEVSRRKKKKNQETASVSLRERTDLRSLKISRSHRLFDCFDPKMVRGNKVTDKLFQTRAPLNGVLSHSPFFHLLENTPQMTKKLSAPTVFQSEDRTRFGGKITQDSSSRARNLKHPAMCTASSGAPGGAEMDASLPAVLSRCSSCQQTKLPQIQLVYGDWHLSLWDSVGIHNTHLCDWRQNAFAWLQSERGRSVHCTDTYTVLGGSQTQRMFHRGIVNFAVCCGDDDNGDDDDDDRLQSPPQRRADRWINVDGCWSPTWV